MSRMTAAQALVEALIAEGVQLVFGLFGHGNVQLGHALAQRRDKLRFLKAYFRQPLRQVLKEEIGLLAWLEQKAARLLSRYERKYAGGGEA